MINPRVFVLITVLFGGMGQGVVAPKLPELLEGASQLALTSGVSATLLYFAIFISTYRYGRLADLGRTHVLVSAGMGVYALTLFALGLNHSANAVLAIRFVEGLAISAVYVAADYVLGRLSPEGERARWLSYYGVALSVGLLLGPLAALVAGRNALFGVGALVAVCAVAGLRCRVPQAEQNPPGPVRLNFAPLFVGGVYGFLEAGLVAVFPILAVTEFHVTPEYCLVAVIVSAAVFSVVWGTVADRAGARPVLTLLLSATVFGYLALSAYSLAGASLQLIAFVSCVLFGALAGGLYPVGFTWLLKGVPEARYGHASGSFSRAYGLGSLVGPLATGLASEHWGARGLFETFAAAGAVGLVVCVLTSLRDRA
jgi:MFS family permease